VSLGVLSVQAEPAISAAFRAALAAANVTTHAVCLPSFEQAYAAGVTIIGAENWAAFGHLTDGSGLGPDVRARLLATREISRASLAAAERCRTRFQAEMDAALQGVDALALPTLPDVPPPVSGAADHKASLRMTALVRPFNLSGHPALTLPLQTDSGRPAGLQLVGRRHADAALCAVARRLLSNLRHDLTLGEQLCN
jgi:amidase